MNGKRQAGFTSVTAMTLLVFLAAVASGGALILRAALSYDARSEEKYRSRLALQKEAEDIISALARDSTPEADSPIDSVWNEVERLRAEGVQVLLQDVSSALNPNWIQKNLFQKTAIGGLLQPGKTADELQQRREDKGFFIDIGSAYGDLFQEDALAKYFTGYGYANINVTDEFVLRKIYQIRTGDEAGAEVFHSRVQRLLMDRKQLKKEQVNEFLSDAYGKLYPLLNVEPEMNVHFVDPFILRELLSYPDLKIPHPQDAARLIVESRKSGELTALELRKIIGAAEENRIYQYLGVTTWFWKIIVESGSDRLELIVARLPAEEDARPRFLIIEERSGG
jgi:hypothetical protein